METTLSLRRKRCAIYTRKSAQSPIGQEVTSLEAQRAICSSYVASQAHKGWIELGKPYEDSGRSGANLDRPALQQLISDIELGLVEIVLVYKLDRITRTLLDFVRLIDFFDRYGVVFVAITQNFDTSDSMGRLIRNILLTFAQFEREIASDRIRDKKLIMKQRGYWTGGDAPLGYDLRRRRLIVNKDEAPAVRRIFETYVRTESIALVHRSLCEAGFRRKQWRAKSGSRKGGAPISLTSLHHILRNPVYIGEFWCKGEAFPALHEPIIERPLWDQAQAIAARRRRGLRTPRHILTGLIFDAYGRRMNARVHKSFNGDRRAYESAVATWGGQQQIRRSRVNADQVERLVMASIASLLSDRRQLREVLAGIGLYGAKLDDICDLAVAAAVRLFNLMPRQLIAVSKALIFRVEIMRDRVRLLLRVNAIGTFALWDGVGVFAPNDVDGTARANQLQLIDIPAELDRARDRHCIPVEARKDSGGKPSASLLALLDDARLAQKLLFDNRDIPLVHLAWSLGRKPVSFARLVRLNYLAPDIVAAIIDGVQPESLSRRELMRFDLPMDWRLQRRLLGFPAKAESKAEAASDELGAALAERPAGPTGSPAPAKRSMSAKLMSGPVSGGG